MDIKPENSQEW